MKNWKPILLVAGILLLIAAFAVYAARIASCYPPANILAQFSPEYVKGFRESCKLDSPLTTQFSDFLSLFIPGIILFSAYWLLTRPRVKNRRAGQLSAVPAAVDVRQPACDALWPAWVPCAGDS